MSVNRICLSLLRIWRKMWGKIDGCGQNEIRRQNATPEWKHECAEKGLCLQSSALCFPCAAHPLHGNSVCRAQGGVQTSDCIWPQITASSPAVWFEPTQNLHAPPSNKCQVNPAGTSPTFSTEDRELWRTTCYKQLQQIQTIHPNIREASSIFKQELKNINYLTWLNYISPNLSPIKTK